MNRVRLGIERLRLGIERRMFGDVQCKFRHQTREAGECIEREARNLMHDIGNVQREVMASSAGG